MKRTLLSGVGSTSTPSVPGFPDGCESNSRYPDGAATLTRAANVASRRKPSMVGAVVRYVDPPSTRPPSAS